MSASTSNGCVTMICMIDPLARTGDRGGVLFDNDCMIDPLVRTSDRGGVV